MSQKTAPIPPIAADVRAKLETLAWYIRRPEMYRELCRRIVHRRLRTRTSVERDRKEKEVALAWCRSIAVPVADVLEKIGAPRDLRLLSESKPALWQDAALAFEACGGTMGGPAHVDLLYHITLARRPEHFVETGVAAGWSSLAILAAMEELGRGRLTSIDMPYPKRQNEELVGCVVSPPLRHRWTLVRRPDRDALPKALRTPIGAAHYDSDKSYDGRAFAYPLLWDALEPGGVLLSDDVEDNFAFRDFAKRAGTPPLVVEKERDNFAGLLVKPGGSKRG